MIRKKILYKPTLIAEIGINHNGDIKLAKKLIDLAKKYNFDYVKFQKRDLETVIPEHQKEIKRETPWGYISYLEYKKKIEFGRKEFDEIDPNYKHQAPQNEIIPLNFILHYTDMGMTVCDLFGGSGTTGAAALKHGRNFITFDLDKTNIEFMSKRFNIIVKSHEKSISKVQENSIL